MPELEGLAPVMRHGTSDVGAIISPELTRLTAPSIIYRRWNSNDVSASTKRTIMYHLHWFLKQRLKLKTKTKWCMKSELKLNKNKYTIFFLLCCCKNKTKQKGQRAEECKKLHITTNSFRSDHEFKSFVSNRSSHGSSCSIPFHLICFPAPSEVHVYLLHM